MPKMTFVCEHTHLFKPNTNLAKITYESNREVLDEIIEDFEDFLRGCGFYVNGKLSIINDEEETISVDLNDYTNMNFSPISAMSEDTITFTTTGTEHNDYYYDFNRNK